MSGHAIRTSVEKIITANTESCELPVKAADNLFYVTLGHVPRYVLVFRLIQLHPSIGHIRVIKSSNPLSEQVTIILDRKKP